MSSLDLNVAIATGNLSTVLKALSSGAKPDQHQESYAVKFSKYVPQVMEPDRYAIPGYMSDACMPYERGMETSNVRVACYTYHCHLNYTHSSLKTALHTRNSRIVEAVIRAGAWLYGVDKNQTLYEDKRTVNPVVYVSAFLVPEESTNVVEFGSLQTWNSLLQKADTVCGGYCDVDAVGTQNPRIIEVVFRAIIEKNLRPSEGLMRRVIKENDTRIIAAITRAGLNPLRYLTSDAPQPVVIKKATQEKEEKTSSFCIIFLLGVSGFLMYAIYSYSNSMDGRGGLPSV